MTAPTFGDNVRIRDAEETRKKGFANRRGTVSGVTTPSVTGVDVIGSTTEDYALAVMFEEPDCDAWFAEDLVEFIDHAPGLEIRVGNLKAVRNTDGTWNETTLDGRPLAPKSKPSGADARPWWKFW